MGDAITVIANLSTKGFEKGSAAMKKAINSLGVSAAKFGKTTQQSANSVIGSLKRMLPTIIGVGSAYGVISKAVSAFMSQNEQLSKQMSSVWTALGNVLGPIITQLITWVTTAVSYLLSFLKLLGLTGKTASELSKSAKGAGSDLQKTIAGFDELNVLQDNSGGGSGGATLKDIEPSEWMAKLAELLRKGMWDEAADMIIDRMNGLIDIFVGKAQELGEKIGYYLGGALHIIARLINDLDWHGIGQGLANFVNGVLEYVDGNDIGAIIVGKITIAIRIITGFLENLNWKRVAQFLSNIVIGAVNSLARAIEEADWKKIGDGIRTFFQNIDWEGIAVALGNLLKSAWDAALDLLWGLIAGDVEEEPPLITALRNLGDSIVHFAETVTPILEPLWNNLLKPLIDWIVGVGLPGIINTLAYAIDTLAAIINGDIGIFEGISRILGNFFGTIARFVYDFVQKVDWNKLWEEFKTAVSEGWESVKKWWHDTFLEDGKFTIQGFLDGILETIKNIGSWIMEHIINPFIEGFRSGFDMHSPSKVMEDLGTNVLEGFLSGLTAVWDRLVQWATGAVQNLIDIFKFDWKLPELKLPHITVAWEPTGDFARFLGVTALPHLGVEWYKRGGVIDGAHLIGAGEDGAEAIVPLERNTEWIDMVVRGLLERLEANDFSVNKIGGSLAALQDIAETVAYKMPSVAQGAILPYSVANPQGSNYPSEGGSWSSEDIRELSEKLDAIIYLFEHFQFVADFGNNLRAFARQITREQKKDIISEGR